MYSSSNSSRSSASLTQSPTASFPPGQQPESKNMCTVSVCSDLTGLWVQEGPRFFWCKLLCFCLAALSESLKTSPLTYSPQRYKDCMTKHGLITPSLLYSLCHRLATGTHRGWVGAKNTCIFAFFSIQCLFCWRPQLCCYILKAPEVKTMSLLLHSAICMKFCKAQ